MKIGVLTGGGDCPGLNAVIRAIVVKATNCGDTVLGIRYGWKGLLENDFFSLTPENVCGIISKGGTILRTSRTNPCKKPDGEKIIKENFSKMGLDALIAIGGDDTLGVAKKLFDAGFPTVGVPKTIDNDLSATDFTFGFDTAVNIVVECLDRLITTACSHNRVMVVEVMGRHAGWIAAYAGIAGDADYILVPEIPIDLEDLCRCLKTKRGKGKNFNIVVVAEGATFKDKDLFLQDKKTDEFGHVRLGGIGETVAKMIEEKTGFETRSVVLGHIQRGGSPTAFDRILGTRFGIAAYELVKTKSFGKMVSLKGNKIEVVSLEEATSTLKTLDTSIYELAKTFFT